VHLAPFPGPLDQRAPGQPAVSAKHGVVGLIRSLAVELGQHGIRVNSVHPTNVNTPMFMNEGTYRLFRPDVETPDRTTWPRSSR
jgi:NAD(P)-dependent dehydrogenase (short-subunit alcohol dehydrogenase family)